MGNRDAETTKTMSSILRLLPHDLERGGRLV
jgi:hypothetical protein